MPWRVAIEMPDEIRIGWIVGMGESQGREFDWSAMAFKEIGA